MENQNQNHVMKLSEMDLADFKNSIAQENKNMLKTTLSGTIVCDTDTPPITYTYIDKHYSDPCGLDYEIYQDSDGIKYVMDSGFMLPIVNYPNFWYKMNTILDPNTYQWFKYNSSLIYVGTQNSPCGVQ